MITLAKLTIRVGIRIVRLVVVLGVGWTISGVAPVALADAGQSTAVKMPAGMQEVTSVEGITEYRLPNGLRVLLFPDSSKQTTTVNITYLVGSRYENYGETGMAHLLEHLMFKGSTNHKDPKAEATQHGAEWNGTTWFDRTNYFEIFKATDENLTWALELEADRMVHSFIAKKDLDTEMTVVRNEYEMGENNPTQIMIQRALSSAFLWHHYGRDVIGARSDIEKVPIERLQAFWRNYYQPDNAILMVAGKFEPGKTLALIAQKFGPITRPSRVIQQTYTDEPAQDGERSVTLRRVGDVQEVCAVYHVPAGSHPDYPVVEILSEILSNTPAGRLHKSLVETNKASSVYGYGYQLREPGVLVLGAEVRKQDSLDAARDTLLQTVEGVPTAPPTAEEVERARQRLLSNIELNLTSSERIGLELSEWEAIGDWRLLFLHRDQLKHVTVDDVKRVAATYLKPSNRTLGLFIPTDKPDRSEVPPTPDVATLLKNYKGANALAAGEAFDPSPANIDGRTQRATQAGLKLALLPKKTRGSSVNLQLQLRFGDVESLKNRSFAANLAGQMLMRGTMLHTRQQIQDELDRLKARANVYGGPTGVTATIETTRENLPGALKLITEVLRKPVFPAAEFDTLKQEQLAGYESQKSEPMAIAFLAMQRHAAPYPKGDVRYVPTLDESIDGMKLTTLDEVKRFYTDFYGASNGELAVVGDFDAAEIKKLAADLFGDWKSPQPYTRVQNQFQQIAPENLTFETPDKANAVMVALLPVRLKDDDPDYAALQLGNFMFGASAQSRLWTRIREKEGLSYGVGSFLQADALDDAGSVMGYAISNPQVTARVETAYKEEMARALKDGFTAEEIAGAKSGYLQSLQVQRAQDPDLASKLVNYSFLNRTLAYDADLESKINTLTAEQIIAVMRKYFDPTRISFYKAGDFAKARSSK
jgi:zinc protease